MKRLRRKARVFAAALILAVLLSGATALERRALAGCGADVSTQIWNEVDSRWTSDTKNDQTTTSGDWSSRSEHQSNNGETRSSVETQTWNPDSSSHEHEAAHGSDPNGVGCYEEADGKPWGYDTRRDTDTDSKGNRKEHYEEIINDDGKCTKFVRDREWDSTGKLIKDVKSTTEVPCGKYILEVLYKGSISVSHSSITYGPNTAKVYLESDGNGTHTGSHEDRFDATMTGECTGSGVFPVAYDVVAKEVKFGDQDELDFSVKETKGRAATVSCWGGSGGVSIPITTNTYTFSLPPEEGASKTYSIPPGYVSLTFTLRKQGP